MKTLPKIPNDKATKLQLAGLSWPDLLIHYLNWASRYVAPRPREVVVDSEVMNDGRWHSVKNGVNALLDRVRRGDDLAPSLSLDVHTRGFASEALNPSQSADRWKDKDFVLNCMGYHHFHLGTNMESDGYFTRTNEVLFARVSREKFTAVALFDHTVFESESEDLSAERTRLWNVFDRACSIGAAPGTVVISPPIAMSGHPVQLVSMAQEYWWTICQIDPKLDDSKYVAELYKAAGVPAPKYPKLEWQLNCTDLGIVDRRSQRYFVFRYGIT